VVITGGHDFTVGDDGAYRVPKRELVSTVHMIFQEDRIVIAAHPEREIIKRELLTFVEKFKASTANVELTAWRERDHDDYVLATALSAWMAEPRPGDHFKCPTFAPEPPRVSLWDRIERGGDLAFLDRVERDAGRSSHREFWDHYRGRTTGRDHDTSRVRGGERG
jgi:hypothetical protein